MNNFFKCTKSKKFLAVLLSASMMLTQCPLAFADDEEKVDSDISVQEIADGKSSADDAVLNESEEQSNEDFETEDAAKDIVTGEDVYDKDEESQDGEDADENNKSNDEGEVSLLSDDSDTLEPYFDFDSYDWSDPTEYLNELARKKYPYWDANANSGDGLFYYWNQPYYNDSWDKLTPVSDILAKDYIKERVDEGAFPTDERFFGVWDNDTQSWTTEPMINYEYESVYAYMLEDKLSDVEKYAKSGDYEEAKTAYLAYHRDLLEANPLTVPTITTDMKNRSDMLTRNLYIHSGFPATGWFYVNQAEGEVSVDVTTFVETKRSGLGAIVLVAPR